MSARSRWALALVVGAALLLAWLLRDELVEPPKQRAGDEPASHRTTQPLLTGVGRGPEDAPQANERQAGAATPMAKVEISRLKGQVKQRGDEKPPRASVYLLRKGVPPLERVKPQNRIEFSLDVTGRFDGECLVTPLSDFWLCVMPIHTIGLAPYFLDGADISPGESLDIVLEPGRKLRVEVVDERGSPVDGAQIVIHPLEAHRIATYPEPDEPTMGSWSVPTDENENVREFVLPFAGTLQVSARKKGYARAYDIVDAGVETIVLRVARPSCRIEIRLSNADEWPQAMAFLEPDDPRYGDTRTRLAQAAFTDGTAVFDDVVGPGLYRVKVWSWDARSVFLPGIRISKTKTAHELQCRLERRDDLGRLIIQWHGEDQKKPQIWVRQPGKEWTRWFLLFTHDEGFGLRNLQPGDLSVVLVTPDGSRLALDTGVRIVGGEDVRITPHFAPVRPYVMPNDAIRDAARATAPGPIVREWIETADGTQLPVLAHKRAGIRAPPMLLTPGRIFAQPFFVQVPSPSAALRWESEDGTSGTVRLQRAPE